jgi:putative endopeptidase
MKLKNSPKVLLCSLALAGFSTLNAQENHGINLNYMDKSVKASDNFFRFVNGTWYDTTEIPSDKTRWGSFDELRLNTDKDVLAILEEALKNPSYTATTDQGKALNLYKVIMDTVTRNKQGIAPIKPYLTKINAVKNSTDLQKLLIEMEYEGGLGFIGAGVGTDAMW